MRYFPNFLINTKFCCLEVSYLRWNIIYFVEFRAESLNFLFFKEKHFYLILSKNN